MNIRTILNSTKPADIFNPSDWKSQFQSWIKSVHPDHNQTPGAREAYEKLIEYKAILENGVVFHDEISEITFKDDTLTFTGPADKLALSYKNYTAIKKSTSSLQSFGRYLPLDMQLSGDSLIVKLQRRSVRIDDVTLEEKHSRWVLNRLLEFASMLNVRGGYTHCGINPNSVLITPEDHGIQVVSFYHTVPVDSKMVSAIGLTPYRNWYPISTFDTKVASSNIDSEMAKRLCCHLLGDRSGSGSSLRGKITDELFEFLMNVEEIIQADFFKYQQILDRSPRTFHQLNI